MKITNPNFSKTIMLKMILLVNFFFASNSLAQDYFEETIIGAKETEYSYMSHYGLPHDLIKYYFDYWGGEEHEYRNGLNWLSYLRIRLYDSRTKQNLSDEEGAIVEIKFNIYKVEYIDYVPWISGEGVQGGGYYTFIFTKIRSEDQSYVYNGGYIYMRAKERVKYYQFDDTDLEVNGVIPDDVKSFDLMIRSKNYETEQKSFIVKSDEPQLILDNYKTAIQDLKIYLIPKNKDVNLSGEITTNVKTQNDLGILSVKEVATTLGVKESDVIKLIETKKIKGKKIGDQYFIAKEELIKYINSK